MSDLQSDDTAIYKVVMNHEEQSLHLARRTGEPARLA